MFCVNRKVPLELNRKTHFVCISVLPQKVQLAAKKTLLYRKNFRDRLIFYKRYSYWTTEDWGKFIFSDKSLSIQKKIVQRRKDEQYHQSCPTVKHTEIIKVWAYCSAKGGDFVIEHIREDYPKEWYHYILRKPRS